MVREAIEGIFKELDTNRQVRPRQSPAGVVSVMGILRQQSKGGFQSRDELCPDKGRPEHFHRGVERFAWLEQGVDNFFFPRTKNEVSRVGASGYATRQPFRVIVEQIGVDDKQGRQGISHEIDKVGRFGIRGEFHVRSPFVWEHQANNLFNGINTRIEGDHTFHFDRTR
jgi:hypothetical protein